MATFTVLGARYLAFLQDLELATYDQFMRWQTAGNEQVDPRIKIVTIDEPDLHSGGQALISDRALAKALRYLSAQNPHVIGLDIYRDLPVLPGQAELSAAFREIPNIVGIQKVAHPKVAPPPLLLADGRAVANDLLIDRDNQIRRGFLFVIDEAGQAYDAFAPYLALWLLEAEGIYLEKLSEKHWRLGAATFKRFGGFDGGYIRADTGSYQILINYRGAGQQFETIPFRDVVAGKLPNGWARDRIVLIGNVAESSGDIFFTPFSHIFGSFKLPIPLSGVEVQAHIISQVLDAAQGTRPLLKPIPEPLEILWILLWSVIGATIVFHWHLGIQIQSQQRSRRLWAQQLLWPLVLVTALVGSAYGAFLWFQLLIPVVPAVLSLGLSGMGVTIYTANKAAQLRQTFGRYLTNDVVTKLLEQPGGLDLGGVSQKITILTSDIRGFTALSGQHTPAEVVTILNCYLKVMLEIVANYRGTINEIMGDGLLIFFGAPTPQPDDTERAIACALAMQLAMDKINQELRAQNFPVLEIGIGINTGECIVGNLGSELHTEYSAIGAEVNLAFRIESYTTSGQIFVSEAVLQDVDRSRLRIDTVRQVSPKGVQGPIAIYEVGGIGQPYNLELPKIEEIFVELAEPLALVYARLDGKQVSEQFSRGQLVQLSNKGAKVLADVGEISPKPLTNLKLNLLNWQNNTQKSDDIYAKVRHSGEADLLFDIEFTAKPTEITECFLAIIAQLSREN
ncbi:MAG: adenylate/guanylate cyclase domain-containing protein [Spirulina sp. SIO3F2]|nr:adenylate/guanylate cyclase domain-containing protein [Spirulina sp. SIO3F2]